MGGFPIYRWAKLKVFLYIYREKTLILGKIRRFSIFEIYISQIFHLKVKKFATTLKKNPLGFGSVVSNFHSRENNEKMEGICIFFVASCGNRAILLVGSIQPIEDISNRSPKPLSLKNFFVASTDAQSWLIGRFLAKNEDFCDFCTIYDPQTTMNVR